jgi:hypothetical protein
MTADSLKSCNSLIASWAVVESGYLQSIYIVEIPPVCIVQIIPVALSGDDQEIKQQRDGQRRVNRYNVRHIQTSKEIEYILKK